MSKRTLNTDGTKTERPEGPVNTDKGYEKPNKTQPGATRPSSNAAKTGSGQSKSGSADKGAMSETPGSTRASK